MNPLTLEIPKALVFIAGKTLLEWSIESLYSAGCKDIVVATGWKNDMVKKLVGTIDHPSTIHLVDVPQFERGPLQTFITASELVHNSTSILYPVDLVISPSAITSVFSHHPQNHPFAITLAIDYSAENGSDVFVDTEGHVLSIRSETEKESQRAKSAMLLAFSSGFPPYCEDFLKNGMSNIFAVLNALCERENSVFGLVINEKWYDVDTIQDALAVNRFLLESRAKQESESIFIPSGDTMEIGDSLSLDSGIFLDKGVLLKGPCLILKKSKIDENAIIGPYASLDEMTQVGPNSHIYETSIFGNSVIPPNSKISKALVYNSKIYQ